MSVIYSDEFEIFDHIPIGVFVLKKEFIVVYWNKIIESYSGVVSEDIIGKNILELYPNLKQKRYYERINNIFSGAPPTVFSPQLHKFIIPCKLPNEQHRVQHTTVIALPEKNTNDFYAVFSIQDLTDETRIINDYKQMRDKAFFEVNERKKAEEKLREFINELESSKQKLVENSKELIELNQKLSESEIKLKELNIKKDKFFSIIAHDLKSPFFGLMGFSELLANEIEELEPDQIKAFALDVNKTAKNLYVFISNLLEWSRFQTEKMQFYPKKINLREAVADSVNLIFLNAARKNITITNNVDEIIDINADQNMLQSILQNLISNAVKFSNYGDEICVSACLKENSAEISVKDCGIGIQENQLNKLFRIDTQYSRKGTANEHGTGLGLVLCKELVEKHNGKIWVESEVNKGSAFTFTIPAFIEK